jgi:hypothetical protein
MKLKLKNKRSNGTKLARVLNSRSANLVSKEVLY